MRRRVIHVQKYIEHLGYEVDTTVDPIRMYKKGSGYITLAITGEYINESMLKDVLLKLNKTSDDLDMFIKASGE